MAWNTREAAMLTQPRIQEAWENLWVRRATDVELAAKAGDGTPREKAAKQPIRSGVGVFYG